MPAQVLYDFLDVFSVRYLADLFLINCIGWGFAFGICGAFLAVCGRNDASQRRNDRDKMPLHKFAYASLLFKLIKSVCLICLCSAGYHGIYQQIIQNYYAKTAPFSNGHSFLPIDNAIFAIKKNISCLNTPNGLFQNTK